MSSRCHFAFLHFPFFHPKKNLSEKSSAENSRVAVLSREKEKRQVLCCAACASLTTPLTAASPFSLAFLFFVFCFASALEPRLALVSGHLNRAAQQQSAWKMNRVVSERERGIGGGLRLHRRPHPTPPPSSLSSQNSSGHLHLSVFSIPQSHRSSGHFLHNSPWLSRTLIFFSPVTSIFHLLVPGRVARQSIVYESFVTVQYRERPPIDFEFGGQAGRQQRARAAASRRTQQAGQAGTRPAELVLVSSRVLVIDSLRSAP